VGENASDFEHRSFGEELALCQRYYYNHAEGAAKLIALGALYTSSLLLCPVLFPTAMRTAPSLEDVDSTNAYIFYSNGSGDSFNTFTSINGTSENGVNLETNSGISGTAGHGGKVECSTSTAKICFDAEL
jgi:hypothetical protein